MIAPHLASTAHADTLLLFKNQIIADTCVARQHHCEAFVYKTHLSQYSGEQREHQFTLGTFWLVFSSFQQTQPSTTPAIAKTDQQEEKFRQLKVLDYASCMPLCPLMHEVYHAKAQISKSCESRDVNHA